MQPFDERGNLLCTGCGEPIFHGMFWIEVRQRDDTDADARMAVHVGCLDKLANK